MQPVAYASPRTGCEPAVVCQHALLAQRQQGVYYASLWSHACDNRLEAHRMSHIVEVNEEGPSICQRRYSHR
jgi:hypothetical protein